MKKIILLLLFTILITGCTTQTEEPEKKQHSIEVLKDFNKEDCRSFSNIPDGKDYIGLKVQAFDQKTGKNVSAKRVYINFPEKDAGSGGSPSDKFSCYLTDSKSVVEVQVLADDYITTTKNIGTLELGKMYLLKIPMKKKPECYYDEKNLEKYDSIIKDRFGLQNYSLKCMDSDFTRGGFAEAKGTLPNNKDFEMMYRSGFCSSGGTDCGWSKCFSTDDDELFESVKTKICDTLISRGHNNTRGCAMPNPYENTTEVKQKCMDGGFEYHLDNKNVISVVQVSNPCESYPKKGEKDCMEIY